MHVLVAFCWFDVGGRCDAAVLESNLQVERHQCLLAEDPGQLDVLICHGSEGVPYIRFAVSVPDTDDIIDVSFQVDEFLRWVFLQLSHPVGHKRVGQEHRDGAAHGCTALLAEPFSLLEVENVVFQDEAEDLLK